MKKSRFADQQIAFALQQAEGGTPVEEVCLRCRVRYLWEPLPVDHAIQWSRQITHIRFAETHAESDKRLGSSLCDEIDATTV